MLLLNPVIEIHSAAIEHGRLFQHLLDANVDLVPVELKAPLRECLRTGVVSASRARSQNQNSNFPHDQTAPK